MPAMPKDHRTKWQHILFHPFNYTEAPVKSLQINQMVLLTNKDVKCQLTLLNRGQIFMNSEWIVMSPKLKSFPCFCAWLTFKKKNSYMYANIDISSCWQSRVHQELQTALSHANACSSIMWSSQCSILNKKTLFVYIMFNNRLYLTHSTHCSHPKCLRVPY